MAFREYGQQGQYQYQGDNGNDTPPSQKKWTPPQNNGNDGSFFNRIKKSVLIAVGVVTLLVAAFDSFYIINEQENAVIVTFGTPAAVTTSGLHFKAPFVQKVKKVDMTIHGFSLGYNASTGEAINDESLMITSDYNFVNVDFFVEYRVTDPVSYVYNTYQPELILKTLTQSYVRDTIGMYPVDDVITTGKNQIQSEIKEKITTRMELEDIGLQLVNLTIQDAEPPTAEVMAAFKDVETAKQGADTAINNANQYRSEKIPAASAKADQILQEAEAERVSRVNEANGQVSRFNAMYEEYALYPLITKQRMYYETMEAILPTMRVIIQDDNGNTLNVLNQSMNQATEG